MHLSVQPFIFEITSPFRIPHIFRRISMKHKVVLLASMLVLGAIVAPGQGNIGMKSDSTAKKHMMMQMKKGRMKDGIMMKDVKMMMRKNGMSSPMDKEMTLANGTKVMPSGDVMMKDGKKMMMKEGMMMGMDGNVTAMKSMMKKKDDMMKKD